MYSCIPITVRATYDVYRSIIMQPLVSHLDIGVSLLILCSIQFKGILTMSFCYSEIDRSPSRITEGERSTIRASIALTVSSPSARWSQSILEHHRHGLPSCRPVTVLRGSITPSILKRGISCNHNPNPLDNNSGNRRTPSPRYRRTSIAMRQTYATDDQTELATHSMATRW